MAKCFLCVGEELVIILPHLVVMVHKLIMFMETIHWSRKHPLEQWLTIRKD